jgi:hypothetical protein
VTNEPQKNKEADLPPLILNDMLFPNSIPLQSIGGITMISVTPFRKHKGVQLLAKIMVRKLMSKVGH